MIKHIENHSTQPTSGDVTACFHVRKKWFSVQSRFEGSNCRAACNYIQSVLGQRKSCSKRRWCSEGRWSSTCKWVYSVPGTVSLALPEFAYLFPLIPRVKNLSLIRIYTSQVASYEWFCSTVYGFYTISPIDFVISDSGLECPVLCL